MMAIKLRAGMKIIGLIKNWPTYFANHFNLKRGKVLYRLRNGTKFLVRSGTTDEAGFNEIWLYRVYFPKGMFIREEDNVVDIGAHIGLFSILASKKAVKGKVYSFEPDKTNFSILKENIKLNGCENIIPFNLAVSDRKSKRDLFMSDNSNEAHSFFKKSDRPDKIIVKTTSLNDFMKENKLKKIDFLKIDCEGAEYEILYNCPASVLKKINKISMEYHNLNKMMEQRGAIGTAPKEDNGEDLKKFLENSGFEVKIKPYGPKRGMMYARRKVNA